MNESFRGGVPMFLSTPWGVDVSGFRLAVVGALRPAGAFRDADRVRGLGEVHAFLVQQAHVLGASRLAHQLPRRIFDAVERPTVFPATVFVSVASGHLTLLAVGQVLQRSLEPAPTTQALRGGYELANLYPRVTGLPKTLGTDPGVMVTEPSPGTYRFKGSTTQKVDSWDSLTCFVHVDAGTYTMDATDWPLGNDSWLMGIQAHISHDDGSEGANVFGPRNYGPKPLKAGTLQCNIFVNTTGEVDKTFTPRLYKID